MQTNPLIGRGRLTSHEIGQKLTLEWNEFLIRTLTTLFISIYFQQNHYQSIIYVDINVHTDNYVIYVHLGIKDTKVKRQL